MTRATLRSRVAPLLFVLGLLVSGFTIRRGLEVFDDGLMLQAARRAAEGQIPYADFQWAYGPAPVYLLAGLFKVFGVSLMTARVLRTLVDAGVALTVFLLVARSAPRWVAVAAWAIAACAMAQPTGANPVAPALLLGLLAVLAGSRGSWVGAAALAAAAAAWRIDFGLFAALAAMATAGFAAPHAEAASDARAGTSPAARSIRTGAATAAMTLLVYLPFAIADGPAHAWRDVVGRSSSDGSKWRLPFPFSYDGRFRLWPPGSLAHDAKDVLAFYVPLLLVIGLALVAVALVMRRARPRPEVAGLAVLAVGALLYLLGRTDEVHAAPLMVVAAALLALAGVASPRPLAAAMAVVALGLFGYGASNRLSALFGPPSLSRIHLDVADGVEVPAAEARSIERMVAAVRARVPSGEPIYSVTRRSDLVRLNNPMVYVLTDRDNVSTRDFALQTSAPGQRSVIGLLQRRRPKAIVRWNDPITTVREPNARGRPSGVRLLDDWLAAHYRAAGRFGFYEVLVPR